MRYQKIELTPKTLVGKKIRTNNRDEMDPTLQKIASFAGAYWGNQESQHIKHRCHPGLTYAVYTDFERADKGEYTYFLGEEVSSLEGQDWDKYATLIITPGSYQKFTTDQGVIPDIVVSSWKEIWSMKPEAFLGKRKFNTDFEVYDQRAANPGSAIIDICIGVE